MPEDKNANVEMWKLTKDECIDFDKGQFGWCASQERCLVVRPVQNGRVDHSVLVDGSKQLIFDNADASPLELTSKSLRLCGVTRVPKLQVKEVRHLHKQREKKEQYSRNRKDEKDVVVNLGVAK